MAEINARREARRRRILENSESRLRRITGRDNPDEISGNIDSQVKSDNPKEWNFQEDVRNGICNIANNTKLQDYNITHENTKFDDEHESFLNDNDTSDNDTFTSEQPSKSKSMLHTLLLNRINFVFLAGIVNILLVLNLDKLFGQTVIIPYLLLMVGRLYSCTTLYEARDGTLLIAALILCNVKPRLIHIFKVTYTLFTVILNDFGLYMFSFVLIRYAISYYYYNDIVPRNV
ncbi:uncharacterized protein LOC105835929 [Monomorium pharaonis]|uniref:uncharacterized protein LOC105835929 n=1 Tax=Monomorium pharaonis TaxID=307658 RepID=UPI00063F7319|nr:uncharacterized protein LOC105835929 [Monomorium pharaonis]